MDLTQIHQHTLNEVDLANLHEQPEETKEEPKDPLSIKTEQINHKMELDYLAAESTTSKKIRGKVQIYVDEAALSL